MINSYLQHKPRRKAKRFVPLMLTRLMDSADLLEAIKKASERGFIKSIDGRKIKVDSPHKALNYCLQSGAGVIAKRWMVINQEHIKELDLCCSQLAFVHDELQFEVEASYTCKRLMFIPGT